jgi:metal-responsive CopG/Arc/MetJ family transcriptional regulator
MKVKTSVTLSRKVLAAVDRIAGKNGNRSAVIESAVVDYVARRAMAVRDKRDRELLDRYATSLNRETAEVLEFQAEP